MNYSTHRFELDLQKHQSQISISAFQYDTAKKLDIGLTDGGAPYHTTDGCIAVMVLNNRLTGTEMVHSCTIVNNARIVYEFNDATAYETGTIDCQIRIYLDGDEKLASPKFILVVAERVGADGVDTVLDDKRYEALDTIVTDEQERKTAESERVIAESERIKNESDRIEAEKDRVEAETKRQEGYEQVDAKIEGKADRTELAEGLANKLDKTNLANRIYGTKSDKDQTAYLLDKNATANSIPQRTPTGQLRVQAIPEDYNEATSKKYVDDIDKALSEKQTALENRVSELENLTLSYPEITSTDYEKVVPAEVGKYALVKMIGGASEVIKSKNLVNPKTLEFYISGNIDRNAYPVVNDDDGSMSITIYPGPVGELYPDLGGELVASASISFESGKYYYLAEGDFGDGYVYAPDDDAFYIECHAPYDTDKYGEEGYPDKYTFNFKIMVWKYEDSDTLEFTNKVPEGTVFEPYVKGFINADVERIESLGANLISFPYTNDTKTVNGITFTVNDDRSITVNGTATKTAQFTIKHCKEFTLPKGTYSLSGGVAGGSTKSYYLSASFYKNPNESVWLVGVSDTGKGGTVTAPDEEYAGVQISIAVISGTVCNNLVFKPMLVKGPTPMPYKPYVAEPIAKIIIPPEVRGIDGYGREGSYLENIDGVWNLVVTKDKNLNVLEDAIFYHDLFGENNAIEVQDGGVLRFVNEHGMAVPNTVGFITRKE